MSHDNAESAQPTATPQPRVRLSVKVLVILVAVALCAWFSVRSIRSRRADQILARHDAMLDVIIRSVSTPPANTTFHVHPGEPAELEKLLGRTLPSAATRRHAILEFGSPNRAISTRVMLEAAELPADTITPEEVARQLVEHYTAGLSEAGLKRIASGGGTSPTDVWKSPDNALDFWIDVDVDPNAKTAEVQIIFIDSQRLPFW